MSDVSKTNELISEAREWASSYASWGDNGLVDRLVDALEAALGERDAALAEIESRIEDRDYWYGIANIAKSQRDAATAVIERVRGVLSEWESRQERNREILGSGALGHLQAIDCTGDLRAALDGAPEPEWEYSVGFNDPEQGWTNDLAEIHDDQEDAEEDYRNSFGSWLDGDQIVRRRKAGPWEVCNE